MKSSVLMMALVFCGQLGAFEYVAKVKTSKGAIDVNVTADSTYEARKSVKKQFPDATVLSVNPKGAARSNGIEFTVSITPPGKPSFKENIRTTSAQKAKELMKQKYPNATIGNISNPNNRMK